MLLLHRFHTVLRSDHTDWWRKPDQHYLNVWTCVSFSSHLFAAGVEGLLQLLPGFWDEAFLHGGEVMRILQGDFQLLSVLLQRAQEVLGEAAWNQHVQCLHTKEENQVRLSGGSQSGGLTQFVSAEGQSGGVLVQVLVEIDAQVAQLLLDGLDLLLQQSEGGSESTD